MPLPHGSGISVSGITANSSGIIISRSDVIISNTSSDIITSSSASDVFNDNCCGEGVAVDDPVATLYRGMRREGKGEQPP